MGIFGLWHIVYPRKFCLPYFSNRLPSKSNALSLICACPGGLSLFLQHICLLLRYSSRISCAMHTDWKSLVVSMQKHVTCMETSYWTSYCPPVLDSTSQINYRTWESMLHRNFRTLYTWQFSFALPAMFNLFYSRNEQNRLDLTEHILWKQKPHWYVECISNQYTICAVLISPEGSVIWQKQKHRII